MKLKPVTTLPIILLSVFLIFSIKLHAYDSGTKDKNRSIAINVGGLLGPTVSVYYESIWSRTFFSGNSMLFGKIGGGIWGNDYTYISAQLGFLTGTNNKHHFEAGMGPLVTMPYDGIIPFTINVGYRYQKPGGWGYFRINGGVVEGILLSGGIRF